MKELLDAIAASPDDDAPRRVYADALLEAGDVLGEFIHVQLDLAAGGWSREAGIARRKRERELWNEHGKRWSAPVTDLHAGMPTFRRGFADRANVHADQFASIAERLFEGAPLLSTIGLTGIMGFWGDPGYSDEPDVPPDVPLGAFASAMASPFLSRLRGLDAWVGMVQYRDGAYGPMHYDRSLGEQAIPILAAALPRLGQLRALRFSDCTAQALVGSGILAQLERLDLDTFDETEVAPILDAAPRLRRLALPKLNKRLDLLAHPRIAALEHLAVGFDFFTKGAGEAMAQANLGRLRSLACDVRYEDNAAVVRVIADSPQLANLVELEVTALKFEALRALATASRLDSLRVLRIADSSKAAAEIAQWPLLKRIEELGCGFDELPGFDGVITRVALDEY